MIKIFKNNLIMGQFFSSYSTDTYQVTNNKPIQNLPSNITKIIFNSEYKSKIILDDNTNIETIDLTKIYYYNETLEHLPPMLKKLKLSCSCYNKIYNFPSNLELLYCSDEFFFHQTKIPNTLKSLYINQSGIVSNYNYNLKTIFLFDNLEELYFNYDNDYEPNNMLYQWLIKLIDNLPTKLKILKLPSFWNKPLLNLPTILEKLYLGIEFNQSLDFLPESIKHIEFVELFKFNQPLDNLPSSIEYLNLQFQNDYSQTINNLPNSIKFLELGEYELKIDKLPKELEQLYIASFVKFELIENIDSNSNSKVKKYNLLYIGNYNVKNNIKIEIPQNLKKIVWYNCDFSVYTFEKNQNCEYWNNV